MHTNLKGIEYTVERYIDTAECRDVPSNITVEDLIRFKVATAFRTVAILPYVHNRQAFGSKETMSLTFMLYLDNCSTELLSIWLKLGLEVQVA